MFAIATDRSDARAVRLLLERGAARETKSAAGESAADWALKFQVGPVLDALGIERAAVPPASVFLDAANESVKTPRLAAERSVALLERTGVRFFTEGGCISCHAQNLATLALDAARANGIPINDTLAADNIRATRLEFAGSEQDLLLRLDPPGGADAVNYALLQLAASGTTADHVTDAMVRYVAGRQQADGKWSGILPRPPIQDSDCTRTAMSIRSLALYGPPSRRKEYEERIRGGASWLQEHEPRTTEDRATRLLGLRWANAGRPSVDRRLEELIAIQRSDGGWAQTPELQSDAYGTGQALFALHKQVSRRMIPCTSAASIF